MGRSRRDFHTAMVATAPGEKLLIGRGPVRNWIAYMFSLFHCELAIVTKAFSFAVWHWRVRVCKQHCDKRQATTD